MINISSHGVIIPMAAESVSHDKMTHKLMYARCRERERESQREVVVDNLNAFNTI